MASFEDKHACFSLFETSGSIGGDNLATALRTLGYTPSQEELAAHGKGPFNFEQFQDICNKSPTTESQDAAEALSTFDLHSNGFMSVKEISHILTNLGEPLSADELAAAIKAMEPDNESQVNLAFVVQKFLGNN